MEITVAERQFSIDSYDLLDNELRLAADLAPGDLDRLRPEIEARRQALSPEEVQKFSFTLAPADFTSQWQALEFARAHGLLKGQQDQMAAYSLALLLLLMRITAWSGFESRGEPLPCTQENKILVFGQALGVIQALHRKVLAAEGEETKNSGTLPAG